MTVIIIVSINNSAMAVLAKGPLIVVPQIKGRAGWVKHHSFVTSTLVSSILAKLFANYSVVKIQIEMVEIVID